MAAVEGAEATEAAETLAINLVLPPSNVAPTPSARGGQSIWRWNKGQKGKLEEARFAPLRSQLAHAPHRRPRVEPPRPSRLRYDVLAPPCCTPHRPFPHLLYSFGSSTTRPATPPPTSAAARSRPRMSCPSGETSSRRVFAQLPLRQINTNYAPFTPPLKTPYPQPTRVVFSAFSRRGAQQTDQKRVIPDDQPLKWFRWALLETDPARRHDLKREQKARGTHRATRTPTRVPTHPRATRPGALRRPFSAFGSGGCVFVVFGVLCD